MFVAELARAITPSHLNVSLPRRTAQKLRLLGFRLRLLAFWIEGADSPSYHYPISTEQGVQGRYSAYVERKGLPESECPVGGRNGQVGRRALDRGGTTPCA